MATIIRCWTKKKSKQLSAGTYSGVPEYCGAYETTQHEDIVLPSELHDFDSFSKDDSAILKTDGHQA